MNTTSILSRVKRGLFRPDAGQKLPLEGFQEGRTPIPNIDSLPDNELQRLNDLLPWNAYVVDVLGRRFGNWFSPVKRSEPQQVPDPRILELAKRVDLSRAHVLEIGCFEGLHTVPLCQRAARVTAIDSRIEHVVKTLVRLWAWKCTADVALWDVETSPPDDLDLQCDVLHHVGVLYHLADPIGHLRLLLPFVRETVVLDTHVAPEGRPLVSDDGEFAYFRFEEHGRDAPFAGMNAFAKWLKLEDLVGFLKSSGFGTVDVAEQRVERSGPRVCIFATR